MTEKEARVSYTRREFSEKFNIGEESDFDTKIKRWFDLYKIDPQIFRSNESPKSNICIPYEIAPLLALHLKMFSEAPRYRKNAKSAVSISEIANYNKKVYKELKKLPQYAQNMVFKQSNFLEAYRMTCFLPIFN